MAAYEDVLPEIVDEAESILPLPDLAQIQTKSYEWFLKTGLRELLDHFSPIEDYSGNLSIMFGDYRFDEPQKSVEECRRSDSTYEMSLYVRVRLINKETADIRESEVYLGEIPKMTERGTFIINGSERVVISQLSRSPGVYFRDTVDPSGRILHAAQIIPAEGPWTEIDISADGVVYIKIGQTRKLPVTTVLRAMQWFPNASGVDDLPPTGNDKEILDYFAQRKVVTLKDLLNTYREQRESSVTGAEPRSEFYSAREVRDGTGQVLLRHYQHIDPERDVPALRKARVEEIEVLEVPHIISATLRADLELTRKDFKVGDEPGESVPLTPETGLLSLYARLRPGERLGPGREELIPAAEALIRGFFFDLRRYDLSRVGRYKMNRRLNLNVPDSVRCITRADLLAIVGYLAKLQRRERGSYVDDIDHLQNKRVRAVGELVQNQMRLGFLRMERVAKERMATADPDELSPHTIISVKPIQAAINSFFGSGQLSQFMDQVNPLSELAHKRRLSAMGPGGLSRQSAKLEVRDVHHSHYGRICPIETPEGANVGLIGYLALYAELDEFGFIRTPYRRVVNGRVTDEVVYLGPDEEREYNIASASEPRDENGYFVNK
ncbi:MAG: hypothetical protein H5T86_07245, partial [Armatimonadetes bacterium]|nr:hypothetical protein [Armatimonadota bacterium]